MFSSLLPLFAVACLLIFQTYSLTAQSTPVGTWLTTDDETGEAKSHIELYPVGDKLFGKITHLMRPSLNHACDKCEGHRKDKPVLGMVIIEDMRYKDGHWQLGRVLYPRQGKWYNLKFWLKEGDTNTLVVRGNVGPFYRTQYWKRV